MENFESGHLPLGRPAVYNKIEIMTQTNCRVCSSKFDVKPYFIKTGWGRHCSQSCKNEAQKTGRVVPCFICKKVVYRSKSDMRQSKSKRYFCDKSCQTIWRNSQYIGPRHLNWKGGSSSGSYRSLLRRSSPQEICGFCGITDKRVLAAHHKDHNHKNNRANNLMWLCHNCHILHHRFEGGYGANRASHAPS